MFLPNDTQPFPRTRGQILAEMHLLATRLKPREEVTAAAQQIQAVANMDGHVTKLESHHVK